MHCDYGHAYLTWTIWSRIDCKTVGFFLKISKEIGKVWRKSLTRAKRLSPVSLSVFSFVADLSFDCSRVLEYAKIRTVLQSRSRKETATTAFPFDFFIFQFASFRLYSLPVIVVLVLKVLWKKIDRMWSDYRFLIFSKMSVQINAKKFSENSWETPGFSRTILHGNLAGSREYKQYRTQ